MTEPSPHDHPTYRILDKIGEGPWTVVYEAWDDSPLQRQVAVKMLRDECRRVPHLRDQFWQRIKAMSDVGHERLLPVYNTDADRDWIVVELADDNLAHKLRAGKIPLATAQSYLAQMLEALTELHVKKHRLHGQIKPANLLLFDSGRMKLSDPGVLLDGNVQLLPGTEKYLAPELADPRWGNGPPDTPLDLYCLGFCVLEMLAGPDFDSHFPGMSAGGADTANLWWQWHASDEDPKKLIEKLVPKSAKVFRQALEMMLHKKVSDRARSADEVLQVLGTSVIPEEIRQDAPANKKAPAAAPAALDEVAFGQVDNIPATASASTRKPTATPIAPGRTNTAAAKPPGKKTPFLQDTRKVMQACAIILIFGVALFIAVNFLGPQPGSPDQLKIVTNPPKATVLINGKPAGESPLTTTLKPDEDYQISAKLAGYADAPAKSIKRGDKRPEGGQLVFDLKPETKPVVAAVEKKPPVVPEKTQEKMAEVAATEPKKTETVMPPVDPPVTPADRVVLLRSTPPGATVRIGDRSETLTTPAELPLPPGTYQVAMTMAGYEAAEQKIEVTPGKRRLSPASVKLVPLPRPVRIVSKPEGAAVRIDGEEATVTDGAVMLRPGPHKIELAMAEYLPSVNDVEILPGEGPVDLEPFELSPKPPERTLVKNSIGMTLVGIEPGTFLMGAPEDDADAADDERPQREVTIEKGFLIGDSEVTLGQFRQFVEATDYRTESEKAGSGFGYDAEAKRFASSSRFSWKETGWEQTDEHPVVNVSWNDARAFCRWLSEKEKETYRLPTEAEWEYACRAGTTGRFSFEETDEAFAAADNFADESLLAMVKLEAAVKGDDRFAFTAPVRSFGPDGTNPWGLSNMHGNVREWCQNAAAAAVDAEPAESDRRQLVRGGSWYQEPKVGRSSARKTFSRDMIFNYIGFRVVREQP